MRSPEDVAAFEALSPGGAHARLLDVTDDAAVLRTVADVVIANAGFGVEASFEETPLSELRKRFATNVFGVAATLKAILPGMWQRRAGHLMADLDGTADVFVDAITAVLTRGGVPPGDGPGDAPALGRALCWIIERSFYQASSIRSMTRAAQRRPVGRRGCASRVVDVIWGWPGS